MSLFIRTTTHLLAAALLSLVSLHAQATMTVSAAISDSVGSISTSIKKSSDSSSATLTAQGPYEVTEVAAIEGEPDMLRLALRAQQTGSDNIYLTLPRQAVEQALIGVGTQVEAQAREYGVAFGVRDATGQIQPFFLALSDAWHHELDNRPVTL